MTNTDTYPKAGLRIKTSGSHRFTFSLVPEPAASDLAVRTEGANIYLERTAAEALQHAILDADAGARRTDQLTLAGHR